MGFTETMVWPFGDLFESDVSSTAAPRISASQQALLDAVSEWLLPLIGEGAEPYPGALYTEIPNLFMKAYKQFEEGFGGDLGELSDATIRQLMSGTPAYTFKPGEVSERWKETYAGPVMQSWMENVLPGIKEGFNIPGVMYSRERGRGVGKAAGDFYGQYVAPTLFSSLQLGEQMGFQSKEAAAGRQMQALGLPAQRFGQAAGVAGSYMQLLENQRQAQQTEWLRTRAEPGWAAQSAMGLAVQPTLDWGMFRDPSMMEQLSGPMMAALMMLGGG